MTTKLSTNEFKSTLQAQLESTAHEYDLDISTENGRSRAFQYWVGTMILAAEENLDTDLMDAALYSKDLGTDLVFEDEANKFLLIAQCKYITALKDLDERAVDDFYHRHKNYLDRRWVQKHGSEYAAGALGDYADHIADGWKVEYRFVTPGQASEGIQKLVQAWQQEYSDRDVSIECSLCDFPALKEYFVRSLSLEESVPAEVLIDLPAGQFFERLTPIQLSSPYLKEIP